MLVAEKVPLLDTSIDNKVFTTTQVGLLKPLLVSFLQEKNEMHAHD